MNIMNIKLIDRPKTIISNSMSKFCYFGWPTAVRLQNSKIAVVASGFRKRHVCPHGKTVITYSEDNGETYTRPAPVIDTVLDDRDGGICAFGESGVIVTSFNNSVDFQRRVTKRQLGSGQIDQNSADFDLAYLDSITEDEEKNFLGATFRMSNDCGVTFGELHKSPVTSPHGPVELQDGTLLWVGSTFTPDPGNFVKGVECVQAHKVNVDGSMEFVGQIPTIYYKGDIARAEEPHAVVLDDGTIITHIRVQNEVQTGSTELFTLFQTESTDNGKTWTEPKQILSNFGGAPPHLFKHSSGTLICTYGFRGDPILTGPFGIKAMISTDNGRTWDVDKWLYINHESYDLGYPSTVELPDGSLITVFYATEKKGDPCVVMQQKWSIE